MPNVPTDGNQGQRPDQARRDRAPAAEGSANGQVEAAREVALRALGGRARSRSNLDALLERKEFAPDVRALVLDRLEEVGLLDDGALARDLVERHGSTKSGPALLAVLHQNGIDPRVAADAVAEAGARPDAARSVLAKKWPSLRGLAPEVALRRAQGQLARRGFAPNLARGLLDEFRAEVGT